MVLMFFFYCFTYISLSFEEEKNMKYGSNFKIRLFAAAHMNTLFTPLTGKEMHIKYHGNKTDIHADHIPLPPTNRWTSITASQKKNGVLSLMVGGYWQKTYTVQHPHTQLLKNVKVYASNPFQAATPGYMCGFTIKAAK